MKRGAIEFFIPFFICFLLFTPLGVFSERIDPFEHSSFFSLTTIDAADDQGYYSYLRSLIFDGDIDFYNENNYAYNLLFTQTGYTLNLWPAGPAVLWAPFFLTAQGCQWVLQGLGLSADAGGYGWSHLVATGLASAFYVFCGLLLLYRTLRQVFSRRAGLVAVWTLFLSSPLVYFTFIRSRMGHFSEFFSISLFLYLWCRPPGRGRTPLWAFSLGCSLALAAMSRYTNAVIVFLPLAVYVRLSLENLKDANWPAWKQLNRSFLWALFGFAAVFSLQLLVWHILFGSLYPDDPHLAKFKTLIVPGSPGVLWDRLAAVLAGPYFGLIYCFQAWLIGVVGLFFVPVEKLKFPPFPGGTTWPGREFKWAAILLALIPFYLTLTWTLAENSSYGRRLLIASIPFAAFGLAALYDRLRRTRWEPVLLGAAGLSILFNLVQMTQFRWKLEYFDADYSRHALENLPRLFAEPEGFLSTSFFRVATQIWPASPVEWFFLAGVPILMVLLMAAGWMLCGTEAAAGSRRARLARLAPVILSAGTLSAVIVLSAGHSATFSQEELAKRHRFADIMKNYPEFIFNSTSPGNEKALRQAVSLNPQSSRAFVQLGAYYAKTGDFRKAAWYYKRSLSLDRTNHNAWWAMGMLLKEEGEKEYLNYYFQALRLQPHRRYRYEYLFEKASGYYFEKRYRQAIDTLKKVTRLAPSWAAPYENIAVNYFYLNDFNHTREYALKAKALGHDVSRILSAVKRQDHL